METADALKRRIEEATRYVKLEQLGLSPGCGFPTRRPEEIKTAEPARGVEVARDVWGDLDTAGANIITP